MKTVRFSLVLKKSGIPEIYLAWVEPKKDRVLKRALSENRVMTLHQELHGGKKDFGTVGYLQDRHSQILLFPKSLRRFADRRVIAIDYARFSENGATHGPLKSGDKIVKTETVRPDDEIPTGQPRTASSRLGRKSESKGAKNKSSRSKPCTPAEEAYSVSEILDEVKRAVRELSAGKSVPAYNRLRRILRPRKAVAIG